MWIFAVLNILKFILFIVVLVVIGAVLIKAKKKRRERMNDAIRQVFESKDNGGEQ